MVHALGSPREALRLFRTKKTRPSAVGMRSLSSVCDDPEPQVAHRALVCAASARHRMPTSSTNDVPTTLSVIRRPAAARERARRPWSAGWHKNTHRTPPTSAMAFRARCIPTFSTRLRPPSLHLLTTSPPLLARLQMRPSQEQQEICFECGREHQVTHSARACRPIRWSRSRFCGAH